MKHADRGGVNKMNKAALTGLLIAALMCFAACAKNDLSKDRHSDNQDSIEAQLSKLPVSDELTTSDTALEQCDESEALRVLDREVNASAEHAPELWNHCMSLYACSSTAVRFLSDAFQSGARFKLGYADFKQLKGMKLGDKTGGVYLGKTSNVYLDLSMKTPRVACGMLLHELVHRLDPVAYEGGESLRTEYRAYWFQTAYYDDLIKRVGPLGDDIRSHALEISTQSDLTSGVPQGPSGVSGLLGMIPHHTRETLLKAVAELYGFEADSKVIRPFDRLPRE